MRSAPWTRPRAGLTVAAAAALMMAGAGPAAATAISSTRIGSTRIGSTGPAAGPAGRIGPRLELVATQRRVTVGSFQGYVHMDPGVWVESLGSALQFDVQRAGYASPVTIEQVIHTPWGSVHKRPLPASLLDGWNGLRHFIRMTVRNASGKVVASPWLTFCPNTYDPERASPRSSASQPYPPLCGQDPFPLSMVWGVAAGWATDPAEDYPPSPLGPGPFMRLAPGVYQVTESAGPAYVRLLHIAAADASRTVQVTVLKGMGAAPAAAGHRSRPPRSLSRVPYLAHPPRAALPDLVPLPSWGISTSHASGQDLLNFGATVWVGGHGPLDVEGFRSPGSPIMRAYQYFWRGGRVIGRTRAGIMRYDNQDGHHHWHFEQFARYVLLNAAQKLAVRSHKVGFCIGPSDPVDLLAPHAVWQPPVIGLAGQCGTPTALWVRETMPVGWGDTYTQSIAGQSFDLNGLPNGSYYIELIANPMRLLHETTTANDVSLRKVILGGRPGHRTVRVPAWHGIDPEP